MIGLLILTLGLGLLLVIGIPAAFSLTGVSLIFLIFDRGITNIPFQFLAQRVLYGMESYPLLAIPLFIYVGQLLNTAGITKKIFNFARTIFGHLHAGIAHVNVVASLIFAGMSGSAVADAAGLGAIEIEAMTDEGYELDFSCGVTAASALIGPILPPSIPVVLYAVFARVSVDRLLMAGLLPGILMALSLMVYISIEARNREYPSHKRATMGEAIRAFRIAFFPLLTPVILVGGILLGLFTATEAAAVAAAYSTILFLVYTKFNIPALVDNFKRSAKISASVLFILASAQLYVSIVVRQRIPELFMDKILSFTDSYWGILFLLIGFLLLCGMFLSTAVTINIVTPFIVPVFIAAGGDPLYFGIVMIMVLMIGQVTPPFGLVLYSILSIVDIEFGVLVKNSLKFVVPIAIVLILILIFPQIVMVIPNLM